MNNGSHNDVSLSQRRRPWLLSTYHMKDAMAGKIDMIITKSVSRFARNLLDCIRWVRKLKERDPPIQVSAQLRHHPGTKDQNGFRRTPKRRPPDFMQPHPLEAHPCHSFALISLPKLKRYSA